MALHPNLQIMIYICIFGIGVIIGRITMAIQYAVMKPKKSKPKAK